MKKENKTKNEKMTGSVKSAKVIADAGEIGSAASLKPQTAVSAANPAETPKPGVNAKPANAKSTASAKPAASVRQSAVVKPLSAATAEKAKQPAQAAGKKVEVLMASYEAVPFFKSGGLGDVVGTLPGYLNGADMRVSVMLPKVRQIPEEFVSRMTFKCSFSVPLAWRNEYCGLFELKHGGVDYYFLDNERYFFRDRPYGEFDDGERMAFLSKAILEALLHIDRDFDILHCNDWLTALCCVFLREHYAASPKHQRIRTVLTIHNLKFQGQFDDCVISDVLGLAGTPAEPQMSVYENGRRVAANYMLGAVNYCDRLTTVSPTYAGEIQSAYYGEGLDWVFRKKSGALKGILNGIDTDIWNPETDRRIASNYGRGRMSGKAACKLSLQKELGLEENAGVPLFAVISRLTEQKGLDLIVAKLAEMEGRNMQLAVLGVGDSKYEDAFRHYAGKNPRRFSALLHFDEKLSSRLYAASDVLLMPSRFEPCGLSQMIAMRYGTVPLVRETGGLRDTVRPYNKYTKEGNGFSFANYNADEFMNTVDCALGVYFDRPDDWDRLRDSGMAEDFSWTKSAAEYRKLYMGLLFG